MRDGLEILRLIRDTKIQGFEEHIQYLFEARSAQFLAYLVIVLGAALATVGAAVILLMQGDLSRAAATNVLVVLVIILITSVGAYYSSEYWMRRLQSSCREAKDLANRLAGIYRVGP